MQGLPCSPQARAASVWMDMGESQGPWMSVWEEIQDLEQDKDTDCPLMHTKGWKCHWNKYWHFGQWKWETQVQLQHCGEFHSLTHWLITESFEVWGFQFRSTLSSALSPFFSHFNTLKISKAIINVFLRQLMDSSFTFINSSTSLSSWRKKNTHTVKNAIYMYVSMTHIQTHTFLESLLWIKCWLTWG